MNRVLTKAKAVILILTLLTSTLLFTGCIYPGYRGDYPELCSVAWANIPTLRGSISNGEVSFDPRVDVLEKDSYGRVLFVYSESIDDDLYYVIIMQRSDGDKAYYYADDCYIFMYADSEDGEFYDIDNIDLKSEKILGLKELNDWDKPLDDSRCEYTEIVRTKPEGKIKVKDDDFEQIIREYHEREGRYIHPKNNSFVRYFKYAAKDSCGRELYVVYTNFSEYTDKTETYYGYTFLVVLEPNLSYDISTVLILERAWDTRDAVKKIKLENGWNTPL